MSNLQHILVTQGKRTGRTTRLVNHVIEHICTGRLVIVICPGRDAASRMTAVFKKAVHDYSMVVRPLAPDVVDRASFVSFEDYLTRNVPNHAPGVEPKVLWEASFFEAPSVKADAFKNTLESWRKFDTPASFLSHSLMERMANFFLSWLEEKESHLVGEDEDAKARELLQTCMSPDDVLKLTLAQTIRSELNDAVNAMDADDTAETKGAYLGRCNRNVCLASGANWWNTSTRKYYCVHCARRINNSTRGLPVCHLGTGKDA